ncbi:LamG-like jellyroll fold domain-containing protein, partial [Candidatus Omnitrophota bacterium]
MGEDFIIESSSILHMGDNYFLVSGASELGGDIDTVGRNITFSGPVVLKGDAALSTGSGAGNITFGDTLSSDPGMARNLTLTVGTGNITFTGAVGEGDLSDGLLGQWSMNDNAAGSTVTDSSGSGNDGTLLDGEGDLTSTQSVAGKIGLALDFDGGDDRVTLGKSLLNGATNFTISGWVNTRGSAELQYVYGEGNTGDDWPIVSLRVNTDDTLGSLLRDDPGNSISSQSTETIDHDSWNHVTMVVEDNRPYLYLNGKLVDNDTGVQAARTLNTGTIGMLERAANNYFFNGALDEVRIYDQALSATELAAIYNTGTGTESTGDLALGTITVESAANIQIDSSINAASHDITLTGNWVNDGDNCDLGTGSVVFRGTTTSEITGANTFDNLTIDTNLDGAKTVKFEAGETQVIDGTLILTGAEGKVLTIASTVEDTEATLDIPGDITSGVTYVHVKDNYIAGGNEITTDNFTSQDNGNTVGWVFAGLNNYTWIGAGTSELWSDAANWYGAAPGTSQAGVFTGISNKNCTIDYGSIGGITINSGYIGIITAPLSLTLNGAYTQDGGTFDASESVMTVNGPFTVTGGTFDANDEIGGDGGTVQFLNASNYTVSAENVEF